MPNRRDYPQRRWAGGGSRGQGLVELALLLPLLLLCCMGAIDFGRALNTWVVMQNAAREGAFYAAKNCAALSGATPCPSDVKSVVLVEAAPLLTGATISDLVVTGPSPVAGQTELIDRVTLTYTFHLVTPIPTPGPITMTVAAAVPEGGQ